MTEDKPLLPEVIKELSEPMPEKIKRTHIHYICPKCISDIYKEYKTLTVQCTHCKFTWCPGSYNEGNFAYGQKELKSKFLQIHEVFCDKHLKTNCNECMKEELQSE